MGIIIVNGFSIFRKPLHSVWKLLKMSHLNFVIFHQFLSYFKTDMSGSTVWPQLSIQTVNVALFARNVEWGFFVSFKHRAKLERFWNAIFHFFFFSGKQKRQLIF